MTKKRPLTAIGCYIFAGGFTLGVRKHFRVLAHLEEGPYGTETARHNIPELKHAIFTDKDAWPAERLGQVDFVYCNPPCAPWSRASEGRAVPWRLDPRLGCVQRAFSLVERVRPKVWAWESVRGAWTHGRPMVDELVARASALGYVATALLVDAARHGVPQRRLRFFLVLHRVALPWEPTGLRRERTVADALLDKRFKTATAAKTNPEYVKLLHKMSSDEIDLRQTFERLNKRYVDQKVAAGEKVTGRPSFLTRRLRPDRPALVLTGGAHHFHPTEDRMITVEESAALCGYPRSFKFIGPLSKQYAQVAQAVTPPVGEYLARVVSRGLTAGRRPAGSEVVEVFTDRVERAALLALAPRATSKAVVVTKTPAARLKARPVKISTTPPRRGSGLRIRQMLVKNVPTEEILRVIHQEFPESKATASDVSWNRGKLRRQGGVP